ncbi:maintenance of telomere capping protein 1 [Lentinula aff. detonsa]|uniref:Maintenance of telomere capping protein 1 n=1 Tax=Lentinula aff. detonsa TaxID=2804958 RepID=A0AA38NSI2_9AGAR|nr:maintenance of telomere capping protein 1 [Lentinula aff. detonsa]KAJ3794931.1 maintenance of telomere capping protein 1 [Lentinula aff. detonsa]
MSSTKSKTKQEEALQLLDDLDSFTPIESTAPSGSATAPAPESETEVLAFLDEITQKSSEPTRPTTAHLERPTSRTGAPALRKSTERVKLGGSSLSTTPSRSGTPPTISRPTTSSELASEPAPTIATAGSWAWGSVWTTASAALQQARTVVDEQVKNLPNNEQAKKWSEGVKEYAKAHQLDKLGQDFKRVGLSTLTDILNVVAPPISEHEVIQIWLSHDMTGYDGIENIVYRAMTRILEQVEGGDLIVNRGQESRPRDDAGSAARDLNTVEGYEAAVKLSQANIDELIQVKDSAREANKEKSLSLQLPTSYSYVYLRVQPYLISYSVPSTSALASTDGSAPPEQSKQQHLQFLLYLSDPEHNLIHSTITQAVPGAWLGIWDDYEWVEDLVAEALRVGVEVIGQEYLVSRMGWGGLNVKEKAEEIQEGKSEGNSEES